MRMDLTYVVDSDVFITAKTCTTRSTSALDSGRAWFITTGRDESSVSTGLAVNYLASARSTISAPRR